MHKSAWAVPAVFLLSACDPGGGVDSTPAPPPSLVPVSQIINALKCELGQNFRDHPELLRKIVRATDGADISAELDLENSATIKNEGEGGVEFSLLGASVAGSGSGSREKDTGQSVAVSFTFGLHGTSAPVDCAALDKTIRIKDDPFVDLLTAVSKQYESVQPGEPKVTLQKLDYTTSFSTATELSAGGKITILIFSIGATRTASRTTSQKLTLSFPLDFAPKFISAN